MILTVMFWLKNTSESSAKTNPSYIWVRFSFYRQSENSILVEKKLRSFNFFFKNRATFPRNRIKYAETIDMTDLFYVSKYLLLSEYLIPFNLII